MKKPEPSKAEWLGAGKHGVTYIVIDEKEGKKLMKYLYTYWERKDLFPKAKGRPQTIWDSKKAFKDLAKQGCNLPDNIKLDAKRNVMYCEYYGKAIPTGDPDLMRLVLAQGGPKLVKRMARELAKVHAAGWFHWDTPLTVMHIKEDDLVPVSWDVGNVMKARLKKGWWFKYDMERTVEERIDGKINECKVVPKQYRALFLKEYFKHNRQVKAVDWGAKMGWVREKDKKRLKEIARKNKKKAKPKSFLKRPSHKK